MTSLTTSLRLLTSTLAMSLATVPAWAEGSAPGPVLTLELNAAQPSDKGCRLTFLINNNLGADLSKAAFEIALFNEAGVVDRLTVLDFKDLPSGKTKVTRFDLAGADCARVSRVLINSTTECEGAGVEPAACMRKLKTDTKTSIAFGV
ncbi:hypothetical protein FJ930_25435 [Mesorhizobium sp. B2-4-15]|uniref:hypothetical protein n=1 Tax=Mesorhizobium sp. B2-4-15 TaxID=2589934 RepID=UPI00115309C6|nr:hypothetical protein [Mesorhizobium sp. B2-4-15]TPK64714.1 hypothetical protein FJ930_25435 [Mesorhizobium sp. B2-4-15]